MPARLLAATAALTVLAIGTPAGANPAGVNPAGANPAGVIPAGANPAGATPGAVPAGPARPGVEAGRQVGGATPAAAPSGAALSADLALATCYGGAVRSYFATGGRGGDAGPYRTTSRCRDINVRNASPFGVEACVIFTDRTDRCNYLTYLPARSGWTTVATNVRDGVNFRVRFETLRYEYEALVAYHAF